MREVVVISGKGGTGKTVISASFANIAERSVIVDCDVDAPNLHLLLSPKIIEIAKFSASKKAVITGNNCINCRECIEYCKFGAINLIGNHRVIRVAIDPQKCEGCGMCVRICPDRAIELEDHISGEWYISETEYGPMLHALLEPGEENSGKLVALLKQKARILAKEKGIDLIIVDGPPGIGCPTISSISRADFVIIVSEPSKSGLHDLNRAIMLTKHFNVRAGVLLNKCDLDESNRNDIKALSIGNGVPLIGEIPFDESVMQSMAQGKMIDEEEKSPATRAIRSILSEMLENDFMDAIKDGKHSV